MKIKNMFKIMATKMFWSLNPIFSFMFQAFIVLNEEVPVVRQGLTVEAGPIEAEAKEQQQWRLPLQWQQP